MILCLWHSTLPYSYSPSSPVSITCRGPGRGFLEEPSGKNRPQYPLMIVRGDGRALDPVQTKWFIGFNSLLVLGPVRVEEKQK